MKLSDNIKELVNVTFANSRFIGRDPKTMLAILNIKVKDSNNMHIMPKVQDVQVETIDDLHDKLSLLWDDYKVEGIVSWKQSDNNKNFVFVNYK